MTRLASPLNNQTIVFRCPDGARKLKFEAYLRVERRVEEGGDFEVPLVHVKEDESFENALRRFKRKCEKSGILSELKKRQHYEKPSEKRKRKAIAARKKVLRKLADERRGY